MLEKKNIRLQNLNIDYYSGADTLVPKVIVTNKEMSLTVSVAIT